MTAHVAVMLPGIMGSELWLGSELIWPGPPASLVFKYKRMAELLREDLEPRDVIRSFAISAQYSALIADLEGMGFRENGGPPTLLVVAYDWRKDNALAAQRLADRLDDALAAHNGDAEFSIVAHSMGGLVARYYLESGLFDGRAAFARVRRLVTLGTPHRGSPTALLAATGRIPRLFLNKEQVQQLVGDDRYPALYQLLPPPGEPFLWNDGLKSEFAPMDVYDTAVIAALQLNPRNVAKAAEFHGKLDIARLPKGVQFFAFAGLSEETLTTIHSRPGSGAAALSPVVLPNSGDGTVPCWSGSLQGRRMLAVAGEHGTIYRTAALRRALGVLLGWSGKLAGADGAEVTVTADAQIYRPSRPIRVRVGFSGVVTKVSGSLSMSRSDPASPSPAFAPFGAATPLSYAGPAVERLVVSLPGPATPGIYRIAFTDSVAAAGSPPSGSTDVVIQGIS